MDFKKLTFSDQFPPFASSPRRKIKRFGLGIVLSFIVLSIVLFNISFKTPFFSPVFQGFNNLGSRHNSSFHFWHFPSSPGGAKNSINNNHAFAKELQDSAGVDEIHEDNSNKSNYVKSDEKDLVLENSKEGNVSEKLKNGSFIDGDGEGGNQVKIKDNNGGQIDKNAINIDVSGKGMELEKSHVGNSSENTKNESISVKENVVKGNIEGQNVGENSLVKSEEYVHSSKEPKSEAPVDGSEGNHTYNGDDSESRNKANKGAYANNSSFKNCDIFNGRWVRDDTKPYYPPGSCPYIDRDFDCHLNQRPDDGYVKWRWQPYECDIPSLNVTDFLERLRGQKLVFVGDSLNRNMWESLVCVLRHGVKDKRRVYEISGRREFKKKGFYAFRFEDYNCTVDFVSSPFLVRESSFNGKNGSFGTLRLDLMDETTSMYHDADVMIFNTGHWWTHEKTSRGEDYYQEGKYVHPRLKVLEAYKRALTTWSRWVNKNIDGSKTQVIFRGYSVTHFRGGPWNSGGQCHKETEPIFNQTHLAKYPSKMRALEHVLQGMQTPVIYLNISRLTDYRKDGHPSVYRPEYQTTQQQIANVHAQDCSHWCLPGVPDTWNELLYASLLRSGRGSWRN
ncbi:Protein trichome birefringence-like 2 [Abeliophyllum distichum]|uniref:Protein trichome birefringence-like 2 n=1 Tax=Abeliophyllum distichum TaxID=126358 RepID=A0ABD1U3G9_9LAMI